MQPYTITCIDIAGSIKIYLHESYLADIYPTDDDVLLKILIGLNYYYWNVIIGVIYQNEYSTNSNRKQVQIHFIWSH